jgi:hypothetical protein
MRPEVVYHMQDATHVILVGDNSNEIFGCASFFAAALATAATPDRHTNKQHVLLVGVCLVMIG